MRKILFSLMIITILFSCDDDDNVYKSESLLGKWHMKSQIRNEKLTEWYWDCDQEKLWDFRADGTVLSNNPCEWGSRVDIQGTWEIKGDILFIDGMVQLPAVPKIVRLDADEFEIEYMYGSFETIREVFVRTQDEKVDYAGDIAGDYKGWYWYSNEPLSSRNLGDSLKMTLKVSKMAENQIKYELQEADILGLIRTVSIDSIRVESREGRRSSYISRECGFDEILHDNLLYNVETSASYARDSVWMDMSINRLAVKYQYQRFVGGRK